MPYNHLPFVHKVKVQEIGDQLHIDTDNLTYHQGPCDVLYVCTIKSTN